MAPPQIVIGADAIERLAAFAEASGWRSALLVMDANTEEAAGGAVASGLAGLETVRVRFASRTGLRADESAVAEVRGGIRAQDPDSLVAVGSGVITDITRYAGHLEGRDFVSVPTAASMDGYASSVAAMEYAGVKQTFPARAPLAIFADPGVIAAAPAELTRSGLGDLLGKATARGDWLASHLLYGEPHNEAIDARVRESLLRTLPLVDGVLAGEAVAIESLLEGLLESGVAMALAGSSRPASGCEHHASHLWDLLASRRLREHHPHGLQVGYATRYAIALQRFAFGGGVEDLAQPHEIAPIDDGAREWLGGPPPEILAAIEEKRRFARERAAQWPEGEEWPFVRTRMEAVLETFPAVERALDHAGIPAEPGFLDLDAATLRATFRYASHLRARYTTIDFLTGQGALEAALERAVPTSGRERAGG